MREIYNSVWDSLGVGTDVQEHTKDYVRHLAEPSGTYFENAELTRVVFLRFVVYEHGTNKPVCGEALLQVANAVLDPEFQSRCALLMQGLYPTQFEMSDYSSGAATFVKPYTYLPGHRHFYDTDHKWHESEAVLMSFLNEAVGPDYDIRSRTSLCVGGNHAARGPVDAGDFGGLLRDVRLQNVQQPQTSAVPQNVPQPQTSAVPQNVPQPQTSAILETNSDNIINSVAYSMGLTSRPGR